MILNQIFSPMSNGIMPWQISMQEKCFARHKRYAPCWPLIFFDHPRHRQSYFLNHHYWLSDLDIHIKYCFLYCVTCSSMRTDPGPQHTGTRHSWVPGWSKSRDPSTRVMKSRDPSTRVMKSRDPSTRMMKSRNPSTRVMKSRNPSTRVMKSRDPSTRVMKSRDPSTRVMKSCDPYEYRGNDIFSQNLLIMFRCIVTQVSKLQWNPHQANEWTITASSRVGKYH